MRIVKAASPDVVPAAGPAGPDRVTMELIQAMAHRVESLHDQVQSLQAELAARSNPAVDLVVPVPAPTSTVESSQASVEAVASAAPAPAIPDLVPPSRDPLFARLWEHVNAK